MTIHLVVIRILADLKSASDDLMSNPRQIWPGKDDEELAVNSEDGHGNQATSQSYCLTVICQNTEMVILAIMPWYKSLQSADGNIYPQWKKINDDTVVQASDSHTQWCWTIRNSQILSLWYVCWNLTPCSNCALNQVSFYLGDRQQKTSMHYLFYCQLHKAPRRLGKSNSYIMSLVLEGQV